VLPMTEQRAPRYWQPGEVPDDLQVGDYLPTVAPDLWARVTRVLTNPDTGSVHSHVDPEPVKGPQRKPFPHEDHDCVAPSSGLPGDAWVCPACGAGWAADELDDEGGVYLEWRRLTWARPNRTGGRNA
jgi:hypothetical protein